MRDIYTRFHADQNPRVVSFSTLKVREDTLYTNAAGEEKSRIRKRAEKALTKLEEPLRKVLGADEVILYAAGALAPVTTFEQLTFGWYIYQSSRSVLVITNLRLLQFRVGTNGNWRSQVRSVGWGDVEEVKVKGLLSKTLQLKYRDGRKEKYWGIQRVDGNKIQFLLETLMPASTAEASAANGVMSLCPGCFCPLTSRVYQCTKCGMSFRDERSMLWRSLLIPGGGYFYARLWFLGAMDCLAEAILLLMLIVWVLIALGLTAPASRPNEAPTTAEDALIVVVFLVVILAIKKGVTIYHCRRRIREFIPV